MLLHDEGADVDYYTTTWRGSRCMHLNKDYMTMEQMPQTNEWIEYTNEWL